MESRYALRELQGAIGYDCRRLGDGRRAMFRHTPIHAAARRMFFERQDVLMVLQASFVSMASLGSHARTNIKASAEIAAEGRASLVKAAFPYIDPDDIKSTGGKPDYDALFDELEAIQETQRKQAEEALANGQANDIINGTT